MPAPLTAAQRARLQAAADLVATRERNSAGAKAIIARLCQEHGAKLTLSGSTNTLRAAGVTATCTWSPDHGLLEAWNRLATIRLADRR